MRRVLFAAAAVAVMSSGEAVADYNAVGSGLASCGTWTAGRRQNSTLAYVREGWVLGFLTGVAYASPHLDPLADVDADGVSGWIDNYCRAHPIDKIIDAAKAFLKVHPGSR